jgi:hypothetical protein
MNNPYIRRLNAPSSASPWARGPDLAQLRKDTSAANGLATKKSLNIGITTFSIPLLKGAVIRPENRVASVEEASRMRDYGRRSENTFLQESKAKHGKFLT